MYFISPTKRFYFAKSGDIQGAVAVVLVAGAGATNTLFMPVRSALVMVIARGFEGLRCHHVNTALASGVHALVLRPPGVDGLGVGNHPRGPVRPGLPVIAEKVPGDPIWHKLRRKECRQYKKNGKWHGIDKLCGGCSDGSTTNCTGGIGRPGRGIPISWIGSVMNKFGKAGAFKKGLNRFKVLLPPVRGQCWGKSMGLAPRFSSFRMNAIVRIG